jgi:osmotically-inducible protein OsmY
MLRGVGIASLLTLTLLTAQTPETKKQEPRTSAATADQQKETRSDREITRRIRRAVVGTEGMSTSGKNVKIITAEGKVTLRGPVNSTEEKQKIEQLAKSIAGEQNVTSQLEVKGENR